LADRSEEDAGDREADEPEVVMDEFIRSGIVNERRQREIRGHRERHLAAYV
jgi:hypothetical protein